MAIDPVILESELFALKQNQEFSQFVANYIDADDSAFLRGSNKRFFSELGFERGLEALFAIPYEPVVTSSFLKLTQEVSVSDPTIVPSPFGNRIISQLHAQFIEDKFKDLNVGQYFSDLLLAYITGIVCHEFVWEKDSAGKGTIKAIRAIPVDYLVADSTGVSFRKSLNNSEKVIETKYKFSKFTYSQFLDTSPLGEGVGKVLYYLLKDREKLVCLANTYAVRGATPTVVLKATGNVKATAVKSVMDAIARNDSWKSVGLPPGLDLTSINPSGNYEIYKYLLEKIDTLIAQLLAGETITGSSGSNSQRGSNNADNLRKTRATRLASKAIGHINKSVVRPLIDQKFGPQKYYPEIRIPMPRLQADGRATITEAIQLQTQLGLEINPNWFESEFSIDLKDVLADVDG